MRYFLIIKMCIRRIMQKRKLSAFITIFIFGVLSLLLISKYSIFNDIDRTLSLKKIDELIKNQASSLACKQPSLPLNAPEIMKFVHTVPKLNCQIAGQDWVKCEGGECKIQDDAKLKYGHIKCRFTELIRIDDSRLRDTKSTISESSYKQIESDVVRANCTSGDKKWAATLTSTRKQKYIWDSANWDNLPQTALKMNVLMFGFDSLSRNAFMRKLPKSYEYLTKTLDTIVLEGYNIVGDGTPQALIPILTGKTELELPDTRKRIKNTEYVNSYPFIWNDYRDAGYVTAFFEDVPELSTFTYRLNGFNEPPTDHYMRPYYLASLEERYKWPKYCMGDTPRHKVMLNAIKDFFTVYKSKPKFLFGFHGELSHDDYNLVGIADDDVTEFLMDLNQSGTLNNTILIIMADHGHRFAEVRNTIQGKQEERLPFFSFRFPNWFQNKYPKIYKNFRSNYNKLVTPFDIYETLKSVLNVQNTDTADISRRSVSLFSRIPEERSCAHAYIEPHWCACLDWHHISTSEPIVERLGATLVNTLNEYTKNYRNLCDLLSISQIKWVTKMTPNQNLLKFKKNADLDGFLADLTANTHLKYDVYQIKAMLTPGKSIFEASVKHNLDTDELQLKLSDVSRINMYGSQARCVEGTLPQLRKYCYCKNP